MAPHDRRELYENLKILDHWEPLPPDEYAAIVSHGDRVHRNAESFP